MTSGRRGSFSTYRQTFYGIFNLKNDTAMSIQLEKLDNYRWRIPKTGQMRVPGLIFSSPELIKTLRKDQSLTQVANVATLPGIVNSGSLLTPTSPSLSSRARPKSASFTWPVELNRMLLGLMSR